MRTSILLIGLAASCTLPPSPPPPPNPAEVLGAEAAEPPHASDVAPAPLSDPTDARYAASYIMFHASDALNPGTEIVEGALGRQAIARRRIQSGEAFETVARSMSEHPSGRRGGALGTYETGTMDPAFERAVASVAVGELAPVVQTESAVYLIRRDAVHEVRVRILTLPAGPDAARLANRAREQLLSGESMEAVAASAQVPTGQTQVQRVGRGQLLPIIERAAIKLGPNQVSAVVESPMGLHVIQGAE
ncbi:MAG: peptidylprolyl isomerase [Myxococcota bacterium]